MTTNSIDALVAIIAQGRQEDRQDLAALRNDMTELTKSVNTLTNTMTKFVSDTGHMHREIEDIKEDLHGTGGVVERVGRLEVSQAEDGRNWLLLSGVAGVIFTGLVGYYFTVVKPIQSATITNDQVIQLIESIDAKIGVSE